MKVWIRETKTPRNMDRGERKRGRINGAARVRERSMWSAMMLPKRRMERERTRAKWLMSSMMSKQRSQREHGPQKLAEVLEPMRLEPVIVRRDEDHQGAGHRRVQVVGGRKETRDEAEEVGKQDEKPEGPDEGQKLPPAVPDDVVQELQHHLGEYLEYVSNGQALGRNEGGFSRCQDPLLEPQVGEKTQHDQHKKAHGNLVGKTPQDRDVGKPGKGDVSSHYNTPFLWAFSDPRIAS